MKKWRKENPEKIRVIAQRHYYKNKDKIVFAHNKFCQTHKEWLRDYKKKYNEKQKEKISIYWKKYNQAHKEENKVRQQLYLLTPKGKFSASARRLKRRILTKGLNYKIIQQVYEENIKQYGTLTCYLCLKPIEFGNDHLEHKIPLSRGGSNAKENLSVACAGCNFSKHTKTEAEYRSLSK